MEDLDKLNSLLDSVKINAENCRDCIVKKCIGCEIKKRHDIMCFRIVELSERIWGK